MMDLLILALAVAGFAVLALSMDKHHRDLFQARPTRLRRLSLQTAGWLVLGLSLAVCVDGFGVSIGIVFWTGMLTVAALAVAAALSWRHVWLKSLARTKAWRDTGSATNAIKSECKA